MFYRLSLGIIAWSEVYKKAQEPAVWEAAWVYCHFLVGECLNTLGSVDPPVKMWKTSKKRL